MRMHDTILKTRTAPIGFAGSDRVLELQTAQLTAGEHIGQFQATYYDLADPYIWGGVFPSEQEAIADVDRLFDWHLKVLQKIKASVRKD